MRLHSKPVAVTFHANVASCATCCSLLLLVALIIVPYVIAYYLGGFWRTDAYALEQPRVKFRHEALVEGFIGTEPANKFGWSTSVELNAALGDAFRSCELRSWSEDANRDGRPEELFFALQVPLAAEAGERLHSLSILLGVSYVADDDKHARLELNGTLHTAQSSPLPGLAWRQRSELLLRNQDPLPARTRSPPQPCDHPFWMLQVPVEANGQPASAETILDRYDDCNHTVRLDTYPPLWTPGATDSFEALLSVQVPRTRIYYQPTSAETVKFAWIQYLAFFIPLGVLFGLLHAGLIRFGVVATRVHNPLKARTA